MLTRDMLKYFAQGAGVTLDFTGRLNSDLYNKYRTVEARKIDTENLASDWHSIESDIYNQILRLTLENNELKSTLVDIIESQTKVIKAKDHTDVK